MARARSMAQRWWWLVTGATLAFTSWASSASAFDLTGHSAIEAAAYRRVLAWDRVPNTEMSGPALIGALVEGGVLEAPACFDPDKPQASCGDADRSEEPLSFWPPLRSGGADLIIDRQLSARAQCQHFMAETSDALSPVDARFGVPGALATTAYTRCVRVLTIAFDGVLRAPRLANRRLVGIYALIHAIQDSFSAAHANRDERGRIVHLLSWTLIDWPGYFKRGLHEFPAHTHHAIKDQRDAEYVHAYGHANDGTPCASFPNPYALPEECLTVRARAAVAAIADLLVLTYRLRARAATAGRTPSLTPADDLADWQSYVRTHMPSVAAAFAAPAPDQTVGFHRADVFVGTQLGVSDHGWSAGGWGSRLFYEPAAPFALLLSLAASFVRQNDRDEVAAGAGLSLHLPLIRRFTIGFAPASLIGACDTGFGHCTVQPFATLGEVIVPLPGSLWLGLQGPRWSWDERALRGSLVAVALGWSHERAPHEGSPGTENAVLYRPPRPDEVRAYRHGATSRFVFLSATAASTAETQWVGGGLELRRDIDRWDRRAGWGPAFGIAVRYGTIEGSRGGTLALAPTVRAYLVPNRIVLGATPALLRIGTIAGEPFTVDVGGLASIALDIGRLEIAVDSPPLSYLSRSRWHAVPLSIRLGLLFD